MQRVAQLWRERIDANRADPEFTLTVSAPTNADAREIGAAIRAELRRAGRLGPDATVLDATDRIGETYTLPLAVGDRVRLFDRVHDATVPGRKSVLGNNGDVVTIRELTDQGMIVRNHTGAEGLVAWRKIQAHQGAPIRLTYGYATTVDTAQGSTATEHIHAMPAGSQAIHSFTAYTAASRHERTTWIVVDEASERRQLASRSMLGQIPDIREADVWRNIGENLSRQPQKASALDMLQPWQKHGARHRGTLHGRTLNNAYEAHNRPPPEPRIPRTFEASDLSPRTSSKRRCRTPWRGPQTKETIPLRQLVKLVAAVMVCAMLALPNLAAAQTVPTIPPALITPDKIETRIGPLQFNDGAPSAETAEKVYDTLDFTRGLDAFLNSYGGASAYAIRQGFLSIGAADNSVVIFPELMDSKSLFLTANADTVYYLAIVDLTKGPMVVE